LWRASLERPHEPQGYNHRFRGPCGCFWCVLSAPILHVHVSRSAVRHALTDCCRHGERASSAPRFLRSRCCEAIHTGKLFNCVWLWIDMEPCTVQPCREAVHPCRCAIMQLCSCMIVHPSSRAGMKSLMCTQHPAIHAII
jgi:hypothetical protein